jgi:hypothetical protein
VNRKRKKSGKTIPSTTALKIKIHRNKFNEGGEQPIQ